MPLRVADGGLFEPGERILWWLRPAEPGSRRRYLVRRFARSVGALLIAAATLALAGLMLPLLTSIRIDVTIWVVPLLAAAAVATAAGVLLVVTGLLALLIPEPACPPPPHVVADLLYVFTDRRLLIVRTSRGSGRAYQPIDLVPKDADPPTYRIDEVHPGVGNVLVGVPGPAGWIPRMTLWQVPDPTGVAARVKDWAQPPSLAA